MKKITLLILAVALIGTLAGCETMKGLAQDIENTGENLGEVLTKQ